MEKKIFCTNCGKEINESAEFCMSCGVKQGKVINYCYKCGEPVSIDQDICLNCGSKPMEIKGAGNTTSQKAVAKNGEINIILAGILGLWIAGLPSIIWYNQKIKGIVFFLVTVVCYALFMPLGLACSVAAAVDAYSLGKRINEGKKVGEWTFFWEK